MWRAEVRCDIVTGKFLEEYGCFRTYEIYYVVAINQDGVAYVHFNDFTDDPEGAQLLADQVNNTAGFSPDVRRVVRWRDKDGRTRDVVLWRKAATLKPLPQFHRNWKNLLYRTLDKRST